MGRANQFCGQPGSILKKPKSLQHLSKTISLIAAFFRLAMTVIQGINLLIRLHISYTGKADSRTAMKITKNRFEGHRVWHGKDEPQKKTHKGLSEWAKEKIHSIFALKDRR